MKHPTQETLLMFVTGKAAGDEVERMYEHFALCDGCTRRADALRVLLRETDTVWNLLAPEESLSEKVLVQIRGIISAAEGLVTVATERLATGFGAILQPAFSGVASPDAREAAALLRRASALLADGDPAAAREALTEASRHRSDAGQSASLSLTSESASIGSLIASGTRGRVEIQLDTAALAAGEWLAILRVDGESEPRFAPFVPVRGTVYHVAEFTDVPDGGFRAYLAHA